MLSADQEWEKFLKGDTLHDSKNEIVYGEDTFIPKVTDIYISTQTKIWRRINSTFRRSAIRC